MNIERNNKLIRFTDTDGISYSLWCKFAANLSYLGYGLDSNQTKEYFDRHEWLNEDQSDIILKILNGENTLPGISEKDIDEINDKVIAYFGETNNMRLAGYILTDGRLVRMSYDGYTRNIDHRQVRDILEDEDDMSQSATHAMMEFMNYGNIRLTSGGIDMCRLPTEKQFSQILKHINFVKRNTGSYYVDISNPQGQTASAFPYLHPDPKQIIDNIKNYFDMFV